MKKSILYFIEGPCPTLEDTEQAAHLEEITGVRVVFQNVRHANEFDNYRDFVDFAGAVPDFLQARASAKELQDAYEQARLENLHELGTGPEAVVSFDVPPTPTTRVEEKKEVMAEAQEKPPVAASPLAKKRGRPAAAPKVKE